MVGEHRQDRQHVQQMDRRAHVDRKAARMRERGHRIVVEINRAEDDLVRISHEREFLLRSIGRAVRGPRYASTIARIVF